MNKIVDMIVVVVVVVMVVIIFMDLFIACLWDLQQFRCSINCALSFQSIGHTQTELSMIAGMIASKSNRWQNTGERAAGYTGVYTDGTQFNTSRNWVLVLSKIHQMEIEYFDTKPLS